MILLTGASGFVGRAVKNAALRHGICVRPVFRSAESAKQSGAIESLPVIIPTFDSDTDWSAALENIDVIIHCAAKVSSIRNSKSYQDEEFKRVNVDATISLARQAALAGVRRFVFISSIKVNGDGTHLGLGHIYTADDTPAPIDAYARSKAEAEVGLQQLAKETGIEITIIRPPLIYGPGGRGNLFTLARWVARGLPLPLGSVVENQRSFVALDNLVDLILKCANHPNVANETILVSDGEDLSTVELLQRLGKAINSPPRLLRFPVSILNLAGIIFGKNEVSRRLLGSLQVDISKTCSLLEWRPSITVDEGLRRMLYHENDA